jgi:hypothetical protein
LPEVWDFTVKFPSTQRVEESVLKGFITSVLSFGVVLAAHLFIVPSTDLDWVLVASVLTGFTAGFLADITDRIEIEEDDEDDGPEVYAGLASAMVVLAVVQDGLSTAGFMISALLMYAAAWRTSDKALKDLKD